MFLPPGFVSLPVGTEWIVILIVALLLFGRRLPEVMRSLGQSVTQFKRGMNELETEIKSATEEPKPKEDPKPEAAKS